MSGKNKKGPAKDFVIYVARSHVKQLKAQGFKPAPCRKAAESFSNYRQTICTLAQALPQDAQRGFQGKHSLTPTQLCQMANDAA